MIKKVKIITEKLWAKNKYDIMAKGYSYYTDIKTMFNEAQTNEDYFLIFEEIKKTRQLPYSKKAIVNTLEHVWGYFKKKATNDEKETFFSLLKQTKEAPQSTINRNEMEEILFFIHVLLTKYENSYLQNSTFLFSTTNWNEVVIKKVTIVVNEELYKRSGL